MEPITYLISIVWSKGEEKHLSQYHAKTVEEAIIIVSYNAGWLVGNGSTVDLVTVLDVPASVPVTLPDLILKIIRLDNP